MKRTRFKYPSPKDVRAARAKFLEKEPRNLFYRVASELVQLAICGNTSLRISEALAVLLQTWNKSYYRFKPFDEKHFQELDHLINNHRFLPEEFGTRDINSFRENEQKEIEEIFGNFEQVLGPVAAAKSLHLLAPEFFPLWDRAIARAYGVALGRVGTNARRYWRFMIVTRDQCVRLRDRFPPDFDILKCLDEYNYCKYTKKWI